MLFRIIFRRRQSRPTAASIALLILIAGTLTCSAVTLDFNGWSVTSHGDGGHLTGTDIKGPAGQTALYFTGTWELDAAVNRPAGILTIPTVPSGRYAIDIYYGDDKDCWFTTDENGDINGLEGAGVESGTIKQIGPQQLQFITVEIGWQTPAEPAKRIALANSAAVHTRVGTMIVPIGEWNLHWWGMRDQGKAPGENIDIPFTVYADRIEPCALIVHGGTPDPAVMHLGLTQTSVTIDFNGWAINSHGNGGHVNRTDLSGPAGQAVLYFTGAFDGSGAYRSDGVLTLLTAPNAHYAIDVYEGDDKDCRFSTDENGEIKGLEGPGVEQGTIRQIGARELQFNTVEVVWQSDAQPGKIIALQSDASVQTPAGTLIVPIGAWSLHWWGMRDRGNAPAENIDIPFTVYADRVEPAKLIVHGGDPDPAVLHIATGAGATPLRGAVLSSGRVGFEDVTEPVGLTGIDVAQAAWVDYDGDGWTDLQTQQSLWRNMQGDGFEKAGDSGLYNGWADIDNDGYLDFFNPGSTVVMFGAADGTFTQGELPNRPMLVSDGGTCLDVDGDGSVELYTGGYESNWVYQPDCIYKHTADRKFEISWTSEGRAQPARGITACDFDNDGDTDIYVTHYRLEANVLWINDGNGGLTNGADSHNARGGDGHGIGSAWGDFDNDGLIDLFAGNFAHGGQPQSQFLKNQGPEHDHHFETKGTCGVHYQESYGSPAFGDYDNDGDLDLFITTVYPHNTAVLFRNETDVRETGSADWQFRDVTSSVGLAEIRSTFQAAWADYDNDGDLDLMSGGKLWRNKGTNGNWLKVKLQGSGKPGEVNRAAIGAQVRIQLDNRILTRQVESSTGRGNVNDLTLHFGLGTYDGDVELEISWPYTKSKQTVSAKANTVVAVTCDRFQ
jgi:hypothetical protein